MDLNYVIAELRAELETLKQITASLEKVHELRVRREMAQLSEIAEGGKPERRRAGAAGKTQTASKSAAEGSV